MSSPTVAPPPSAPQPNPLAGITAPVTPAPPPFGIGTSGGTLFVPAYASASALTSPNRGVDIKDMDDDELFEEIFNCGVPLLELIVLQARGWQRGNPLGVLAKAIMYAACAEPTTTIYSGLAETPFNFQFGYDGKSGQGKGMCMSAPMRMLGTADLIRQETPASGEALIAAFFDRVQNEETKTIEAVRHKYPVLAVWDEIDSFAAKTAGKNATTLESHIRSLFSGNEVGDKSLTREKDKVGSHLDAMTYRFCAAFGIQPRRAAPLMEDGGGGTLQRTCWVPVTDYDAPTKAVDIRAVRDALAKRLGKTTTPDDPPTLHIWGPKSVTTDMTVQDYVLEQRALVVTDSEEIPDEDRHRLNYQVRLAGIAAAWEAGYGRAATVTMSHMRWADALMEVSARERKSVEKAGSTEKIREAAEAGKLDHARRRAAEDAADAMADAMARSLVDKLIGLCANGAMNTRSISANHLSKKQRAVLGDALMYGEEMGLLAVETTAQGRFVSLPQT